MYYFCKQYGNRVFLRDTEGDQIITKHPFHLYFLNKSANTKYKNIEGKPLKRVEYNSVSSFNQALREFKDIDGSFVYGINRCDYQYILQMYDGLPEPKEINVAIIDIEVKRDEKTGFSSPNEAFNVVDAISIWFKGIFYVFGIGSFEYDKNSEFVRDSGIQEKEIHYIECKDEQELFAHFIHWMEVRKPHVISGWNTTFFDIPYLINRGRRILSPGHIERISPFGKIFDITIKNNYGKDSVGYDIVGISHLDFLELYKKFTYIARENYQLDTIAHVELKSKKLDYSEYRDLKELSDNNFQKYIEYNIKDVWIVHKLNEKMRLFELITGIAYMTGVNYEDVYSPVKTWDVFLYRNLAKNNIFIPSIIKNKPKQKYIGAYVKDIEPCRLNWVMSFDLASLYPHLQMGYNISPEMLVEPYDYTDEMKEFKSRLGRPENVVDQIVNREFDLSFLKDANVSLTPNGQFYRRDRDGFIPIIIENLYSMRSKTKKEMIKYQIKEQETGTKYTNEISSLNNKQMAFKILLNSEYGAMANKFFRWYDIRNAEAITSTGQLSIKWIGKALDIFMNDLLGTSGKEYVAYSDTDSVYITVEDIVNKYFSKLPKEKIVDALDKFAKEKIQPFIENSYGELADYVNAHKQKMSMKREVIADRSVHTGKKRYIMNVLDSEGVRYKKPKLKMMGIEAVRSSTPEICREAIKEVVRLILQAKEEDVQEYVTKFKEDFFKAPIEEISFPRSVNEIEKWYDPVSDTIEKGTPIAVRGAIIYNKMIDKYHIKDYNKINSGDKIKFCYLLEPNITGGNIISFVDYVPDKIRQKIEDSIDRSTQFQKSFLVPIDTLLSACKWSYEKRILLTDFFN